MDFIADDYRASQPVAYDTLEAMKQPGKSGLSDDPTTNWQNMIWKAEKARAGTYRRLTIQLSNGAEHQSYCQFQ